MARRIHCGINTDPANPQGRPTVQQLQNLGATWVRFTFKDPSAGPQPAAFPFYDAVVAELYGAGIQVLMILSYETYPGKPAHDAGEAAWNAYIAPFAARCGQIAQHYGPQVAAYQVWNEPDLLNPSPAYDPCVPAPLFGRMLKEASTAIRAASGATVVTGGLASGQPAFLQQVIASTNGVLPTDAAAIHPYGQRPTSDWPNPGWGFGVLGDLLRGYQQVTNGPIWVTEVGTTDAAVQNEFPRRAYEAVNQDLPGVVPNIFWFCWSDGMVPGFGLLDGAGGPKACYASYQGFAQQPPDPAYLEVIDRPSAHWSNRLGQAIRYIIIHSTASPVGVPAENTLLYLVGPNDRGVSVHELALPGNRVYRLVPDGRAANHCWSPTVHFPDGTPGNLANQTTWGIEAYQVAGKPVGEEVLATTVRRAAAACRRLGLSSSQVLGHREIDPDTRSDPVGVDMDAFRAAVDAQLLGELGSALLAEGDAHQVIHFNPNAALQARMFADGFVPNSPEFDVVVQGVAYRGQRAEHLGTGKVRVYYAVVPNWNVVHFVESP